MGLPLGTAMRNVINRKAHATFTIHRFVSFPRGLEQLRTDYHAIHRYLGISIGLRQIALLTATGLFIGALVPAYHLSRLSLHCTSGAVARNVTNRKGQ